MCLTETYNRVRVGKNLSDVFPIRNGLKKVNALLLLFNFALGYAVRKVQVIQDGLKLNDTRQLLVYADVNMLGGSVHTVKENTETLVVANKEIGLEVNADKTSSWSYLEIRMQDEVTVQRLIIVPLKWLKSSNIWKQFQQIKVIFRKKLE